MGHKHQEYRKTKTTKKAISFHNFSSYFESTIVAAKWNATLRSIIIDLIRYSHYILRINLSELKQNVKAILFEHLQYINQPFFFLHYFYLLLLLV